MQPKVTVICPVYNTREYLPGLVDSLLGQTLTPTQILLVDDGSTDGSGEYLQERARESAVIQVIRQNNAGCSRARNHALELATGDFLAFVDSDDYLDRNYLECLVQLLEMQQADCAVAAMVDHRRDGTVYRHRFVGERSPFLITPSMCNKMFRRKLLEGLCFPEGLWYEDYLVFQMILLRQPKLVYTDSTAYHCNTRSESIMINENAEKNLDIIEVQKRIHEAVSALDDPALSLQVQQAALLNLLHTTIQRLDAMHVPERKACIRKVRQWIWRTFPAWWTPRSLSPFSWNQKVVLLCNGFGLHVLSRFLVVFKKICTRSA